MKHKKESKNIFFKLFKRKKKIEEESTKNTKKLSSIILDPTEELPAGINLDSEDLFEKLIGSKIETKPEDTSEISIPSNSITGIHSHVQTIKKRNEKPLIDSRIREIKDLEKKRLANLRKEILSRNFGEFEDVKKRVVDDDKLKILNDLGYVSPTKGYISLENKLKTIEEIKKETTIEQILAQSYIVEGNQIIDNISNDLFDDFIDEGVSASELSSEINPEQLDETIEEQLLKTIEISRELDQMSEENELLDNNDKLKVFNEDDNEIKIEEENSSEFDEDFSENDIVQDVSDFNKESDSKEIKSSLEDEDFKEENSYIEKNLVNESSLEKEFDINKWCTPYKKPKIDLFEFQDLINEDDRRIKLEKEGNEKQLKINELFKNFNIGANVSGFNIGPTVTTYEIEVSPGTKIARITNLEDNIKLRLKAKDIRIQAPIPGKPFVGIEAPNDSKKIVTFYETINQAKNRNGEILLVIGQDTTGKVLTFDLAEAPHLLIAGSTGSGKSVSINTILISILLKYSPKEIKLILIDPKMVEFTPYHDIPHLITPVITSPGDANFYLKETVSEMERRYKLMSENRVRNIKELNEKLPKEEKIPYLVVVIDELADLMLISPKDVEESIMRITQKARAAGIHMIVATQRPSTDIITGVIKSNIPSRIAFTVASSIDSRTILDQTGAEKLVGMGDMLVSLYGKKPLRAQGSFISSEDVKKITDHVKSQCSPNYEMKIKEESFDNKINSQLISENDPQYISAKNLVIKQQKASTSFIQRYLNIGYNKAANIIETLESNGIVGPQNGSRPREVLVGENDEEN